MIIELNENDNISSDIKLERIYEQLKILVGLLRQRELTAGIIDKINQDMEELNSTTLNGKDLRKLLKKKQTKILNLLEKELKIVPKDHYKNLWLAIGPSTFGFPIGIALSSTYFGNIAFFVIGMPIGILIGLIIGTNMDKKAHKEGRQLDIFIKI